MTNQEIYDLMDRFQRSSLRSMKLSCQDFTIELEQGNPAASPAPAAAAVPAPAAAAAAAGAPCSSSMEKSWQDSFMERRELRWKRSIRSKIS